MATSIAEPALPVRPTGYYGRRRQLRKLMGRSNELFGFLERYSLDVHYWDGSTDFDYLDTNYWTVAGTNGTDFALSAHANGMLRATRGATNGDYNSLVGDNQTFYGDQRVYFVARLRTSLVTNAKVEVGLTDATGDSTGAITVDQDLSSSPTATATDCAVLTFDSTGDASLYACSAGTSMTAQFTDSGFDMTTNTWFWFMIGIDEQNTARFWINGQLVAKHASAVEGGNALYPWLLIHEVAATGTPTCDIDLIHVWQERDED